MRGLGNLLLTAAAILVFLAFFGLAIYVGVFLFLGVAVYLFIAGARDEFLRYRREKNLQPSVIDMGEVEIVSPRELEGDSVLWKCAEGLPLGIAYNTEGISAEKNVLLLAIRVRRGGAVLFDVWEAANNQKHSWNIEQIVQIREADGSVMTVQQFLKKRRFG